MTCQKVLAALTHLMNILYYSENVIAARERVIANTSGMSAQKSGTPNKLKTYVLDRSTQ